MSLLDLQFSLYDLCEKYDHIKGELRTNIIISDKKFMDIVPNDVYYYFLFCISLKDRVTQSDVNIINDFFGEGETLQSIAETIEERKDKIGSFGNAVPFSIIMSCKVENKLYDNKCTGYENLSERIYGVFEAIGQEILAENEVAQKRNNSYLEKIKSYLLRKERGPIFQVNSGARSKEGTYKHGYEKVTFLGREYIIPDHSEINQFCNLMESIAKAYDQVNSFLQKSIEDVERREDECEHMGFCIQMQFWDDMNGRGDSVDYIADEMVWAGNEICPLGDNSDNYSKRTSGYIAVMKLADIMESVAKNMHYKKEGAIEYGQEVAYRNAAANITGMPYGIITNSAVDLLFYNAVSNATLKRQLRKADEQYSSEAAAAAVKAHSEYARQMEDIYYNQYLPTIRKCIKAWINEATERALTYEIKNNHPLYSEIKKYSQQDSHKIISQIDSSLSKQEIITRLQLAFEKCPFNSEIYIKAAGVGVIDLDTLNLAFLYNCDIKNSVCAELEKQCRQSTFDTEKLKNIIDLLGACDYAKTRQDILKQVFESNISIFENLYGELKTIVLKNDGVLPFIQTRLPSGKDCESFTNISNDILKKEIEKYINSISDKGENISFLIDEGLLDIDVNSDDKSFKIDDINKRYIEAVSSIVINYHEKMVEERARYIDQKGLYDKELAKKVDHLNEMKLEAENINVLKFKRKKMLENCIREEETAIREFEKQEPRMDWVML